MDWIIDKSRAICPQISEQLCMRIANGGYAPDERLMSVRELAMRAGVNPNTVQRSFEELEQQGILYSVRGSGWYVSEDVNLAKNVLEEIKKAKTKSFFEAMNMLGLEKAEVKKYIEEWEE